jgi:hypothetical protein
VRQRNLRVYGCLMESPGDIELCMKPRAIVCGAEPGDQLLP